MRRQEHALTAVTVEHPTVELFTGGVPRGSVGPADGVPVIPVADQLWLMAHDEVTGRAQVHEELLGLGLAAGLLAELLFLPSLVRLSGERLSLVSRHDLPWDAQLHRLVSLIAREPRQLSVGTWLLVLAVDAREQVARRLADTGRAIVHTERWFLRRQVVYRPAPEWAAYPIGRLHAALHRRPMDTVDAVLAGLVMAVGLYGPVTEICDPPHPSGVGHPSRRYLAAELKPVPALGTLLNHLDRAIAATALRPV